MSRYVEADKVKPKKVDWLWQERIPKGMLTVVAGKPDQGKGLFVAHVAANISKRGGNVLYSAIEDDHGMMTRPRLQAAGANLNRILLWRFGVPAQLLELEQIVKAKEIDLVVMDPFNAHLTRGVSRFSDSIRQVTTPLSGIAEETGCAFLITEHALKKVAKDAPVLNAIGGNSSGLPAASRMAYIFGKDPDDEDRSILAPAKHNLRSKPPAMAFESDLDEFDIVGEIPSLILQGEEEGFDPRRLLMQDGDGTPGRKPDKRAAASEWLTTYLYQAPGPVKAGEVLEDAKQYAMSAKTVRRAADDMGVVRTPPGGGRNCTWELPAELNEMMDAMYKAGGDDA